MATMTLASGTAKNAGPLPVSGAVPKTSEALVNQLRQIPDEQRSLAQILLDCDLLDEHVAPMLADLPVPHLRRMLIAELGVAEEDVQRASALTLGQLFVDPTVFEIERSAVNAVQASIARQHIFIPLCFTTRGLIIAAEDPDDADIKAVLALNTQHSVEFVVATRESIERAISSWYGPEDDREAFDEIKQFYKIDGDENALALEATNLANEKPVVRLVHNVLIDAIRHRASDIHIRPLEDSVELLFRLDGALVKMRSFPKSMLATVVSRIKIIGNMDIAEHRLPQDGRFRIHHNGHDIDLRLSTMPTVQGESVVIRVLNPQTGLTSIDQLGLNEADAHRLTELLSRSSGMILVTGPTGCGKSTTLYAALQEIRKRVVSVVTVEDPVENRLEGINQIQVNTTTGLTFAHTLRHILRHDPDVIMVGEIRDRETAKMAVESSLTGHLVLSTLHTNDAASAVTRMLELDIEPYLIKTSLSAVLAQRLVRRNCHGCMEQEPVESHVRAALGVSDDEAFFKGAGCLKCHGTGYSGRRSVYELLTVTDELRQLIGNGAGGHDIEALATAAGMQKLTDNAIALARTGETSLAEVYRVRLAG